MAENKNPLVAALAALIVLAALISYVIYSLVMTDEGRPELPFEVGQIDSASVGPDGPPWVPAPDGPPQDRVGLEPVPVN